MRIIIQKYIKESQQLFYLAWPVILAQFSHTAVVVADTMMVGHFNPTDLSAVAIGMSIWMPTILFGQGLIMILTPIIAQLNGAGERNKIAHHIWQGFWIVIGISILLMLFLYRSDLLLQLRGGIEPELSQLAVNYLRIMMLGVPGYLLFQLYRCQCEGLSKTKPSMVIGFITLFCNLPINYILIYGKFGIPALGGIGCGIASMLSYWLMFFLMYYYVSKTPSQRDIIKTKINYFPDVKLILRLVKLGLPIAVALFFEVSLFATVSILIAPLGINTVAGHNIMLNFSSLIFVLPLALSISSSIRVGHQLGEKSLDNAKLCAQTGLLLALILSVIMALFILLFRFQIPLLYTTEIEVLNIAFQLVIFLAIYQCSDYLQVVGGGILRGYKDTSVIFIITLIAFWGLGLPSGYILGLTDIIVPAMGPAGFWIGFIIGLTCSAILMIARIFWIQKQPESWLLKRIQM